MSNVGICPVCNGTKRVPAGDSQYKSIIAGYDKNSDTFGCRNCGGQYMGLTPTGQVRLSIDGTPCKHSYKSKVIGRCLTEYTCVHCSDRYEIDSGD